MSPTVAYASVLLHSPCHDCLFMSCSWLQFDDEFVAKHYPQFESAEDLRSSLLSSTSLARMQDVNAQVQDAIVTQVRLFWGRGAGGSYK